MMTLPMLISVAGLANWMPYRPRTPETYPGALTAPVMRMAARHVETGVTPEHYPLVAGALLPAIRDVLGDAATDEILAAWGEAYWLLADISIGKEAGLCDEMESSAV